MSETRRPIAATVVSWLMVGAGVFGLMRGLVGARTLWPIPTDLIWVVIVDLIGVVAGIFMLRGRNWARWLTLIWVGGHVVIVSIVMPQTILVHALIFGMIAYLMFRSDVLKYFRV